MKTKASHSKLIKVAVIAFDDITPFHLSVPSLVFGAGLGSAAAVGFVVTVCAEHKGALRTVGGFEIFIENDLSALNEADIVVMPSWYEDYRSASNSLLDALHGAHQRGAKMVGLCLGAFPLAQAGLLNGKGATTHWLSTGELEKRYPSVSVNPEVLYVDEGNIITSGGVAAGLDCCLYILRQITGAEIANKVARWLLIAPHRDGGQAQFIERPLPVSGTDNRLSQVLDWVGHNLAEPHNVDSLAERAAMSRRNFTRHFRQLTGTSFKQWLLSQRLTHAQQILETSDLSIELIAQAAGFGTALSLRQHFKNAFHTSPSLYRRLFRQEPSALAAEL
ncbi:MAG TPA: helix-turn-helix domain-containing protein [Cellvibrio sp.]|jgi:transcriptional regulator GlxA family with amidase domain